MKKTQAEKVMAREKDRQRRIDCHNHVAQIDAAIFRFVQPSHEGWHIDVRKLSNDELKKLQYVCHHVAEFEQSAYAEKFRRDQAKAKGEQVQKALNEFGYIREESHRLIQMGVKREERLIAIGDLDDVVCKTLKERWQERAKEASRKAAEAKITAPRS